MEMTGAFSSFANQGVYIEPILFTRIEDKNGNTILRRDAEHRRSTRRTHRVHHARHAEGRDRRRLQPEHRQDRGTGMRLRMGWGNRAKYGNIKFPTAGKTGTTQNNSDGWFIGITPTWLPVFGPVPMTAASGSAAPIRARAPTWHYRSMATT
jgi:penicillin-binding protein 1A